MKVKFLEKFQAKQITEVIKGIESCVLKSNKNMKYINFCWKTDITSILEFAVQESVGWFICIHVKVSTYGY